MRRPRLNSLHVRLRVQSSGTNFAKFAAATFGASLGLGYACLLYVERMNPNATVDVNNNPTSDAPPSRDEALVRAMIQNAKESSWQENLSNAIMAQERFVLPERHPGRDSGGGEQGESKQANSRDLFVKKIVERSDRWLAEQKAEAKRRKQLREDANHFSTLWGQDDDKNGR